MTWQQREIRIVGGAKFDSGNGMYRCKLACECINEGAPSEVIEVESTWKPTRGTALTAAFTELELKLQVMD